MSNIWTLVCLGAIVVVLFLPFRLLWDCLLLITVTVWGKNHFPDGKHMVHPGPEPGLLQVLGGPDDPLCWSDSVLLGGQPAEQAGQQLLWWVLSQEAQPLLGFSPDSLHVD